MKIVPFRCAGVNLRYKKGTADMPKAKNGHHPIILKNQLFTEQKPQFGHRPVATSNVDGIEMGVLANGTPYLTLRGLAKVCGVDHAPLLRLANNWGEEVTKPRGKKIATLLTAQGHPGDFLYERILGENDEALSAFPDSVCMAILEYYAFEAGSYCTETAVMNYRFLARKSFRLFIYESCGYAEQSQIPDLWRPFLDRTSLLEDSLPEGYFGIFNEIRDLFVKLARNGIHSDPTFLPDISVGKAWSEHWVKNNLDQAFGARIKYDHDYPDYYPQALSNPQQPWAYPNEALAEFKKWFRQNYVNGGKLENYLSGKRKKQELPAPFVSSALEAFGLGHVAPRLGR